MAIGKFYVALGTMLLFGHSIVLAGDFAAYRGRDAVQQGNGGEKKTVDGVDFWSNGAPHRKFKIIGYVTDPGRKSGLIGMIRKSGLEASIAKEAKKAGGDAVILTNPQVVTATTQGQSNSATLAVPVEAQHTKYAVIKYLADRSGDARAAAP